MSIFLLHNKWSRVDGLYLTFLHYQPRKKNKTCLLTLISVCEAANSILAWKQTELILDPDNIPEQIIAGNNRLNPEMLRVADKTDIYCWTSFRKGAAWLPACWPCSLFLGPTLACLRPYWGIFFIGNVVNEYS